MPAAAAKGPASRNCWMRAVAFALHSPAGNAAFHELQAGHYQPPAPPFAPFSAAWWAMGGARNWAEVATSWLRCMLPPASDGAVLRSDVKIVAAASR